tara:strand:+ start:46 stop:393 length:348 start_codon:yes stop_codon:yes gene_type:complete
VPSIKEPFQLISGFFGLTPKEASEFRLNLFSQIHQIVFNGKGGYDWNTIYNMPIWLRKFTFNEIKKHYDEESAAYEKSKSGGKSGQKTLINNDGTINTPEFAQASKLYKGKTGYK